MRSSARDGPLSLPPHPWVMLGWLSANAVLLCQLLGERIKATDIMPAPAPLGLMRCSLPSSSVPAKCVLDAALVFWLWQWEAS